MMKKSLATLAVAVMAVTSGFSYAADNTVTLISSGVYVENTAAGCSLLRDRVTVNTSNNVTMVYNCLTAPNKINVGSCHSSGSQRPTSINCVVTGTDDDDEPIFNDASCADEDGTFEIAGRRGFTGSTTGGSVAQASLNSTTCDVQSLGALNGVAN